MFSFAHPPGKLALPSRLHELQLQRTLLSSSLSLDKICGGGVLLKNEGKKKKNLNVVRYWASRTGPETLRGLLRRSMCPSLFCFLISLYLLIV